MDVLTLSRIQFAVATYFHFIFVPLTLGLSILVAFMETIYVRTGDEDYKRMAKFWGKLFLINFAIGVVTGITLEFQFGTNWSRYSEYVGDIFGSLLAIEATLAFFLESTFIAVWVFGWKKLSPRMHVTAIWLVALASNISAFWILAANSFMQHPVGYVIRNGRAELTDFFALLTSKFTLLLFVHTLGGAFILVGFFVMGVSAYHLLKKSHVTIFTKSFRIGMYFALIFSLFELAQGHMHAEHVAEVQPAKFAAMESLWETTEGAPMYLLMWPDAENETNLVEALPIPNMLSLLATSDPDAKLTGLKDIPPEDRPPVLVNYLSFRIMVGLGTLFALLSILAWWRRNKLLETRWLLRVLLWSIPLPYIAIQLGWTLAEVGRQPWIVYGLMRTKDAVSPIATSQVLTSLIGFFLLYSVLGAASIYMMVKYAKKGPPPPEDAAPAAAAATGGE